jgi:hypothetical protein
MFAFWLAVACGGAKQAAPEPAPVPPAQAEAPVPPAPPMTCLSGADCPSGVCEGEGCGDATPGTCAPPEPRACTRDLRQYCGCDGHTFQGSGSCPGARFEQHGPCEGDPLPTLPPIQPPTP